MVMDIFDEEITLIEEAIDSFNSIPLIYNWQTHLYLMNGSMIAYIDDNGDLCRTNNEVDPMILDSCWNHFMNLTST